MSFQIISKDQHSKARCGILKTAHGEIATPIFMPVGTAGTVKAVHFRELQDDISASIILSNTYHLYLRPGIEVLKKAGGLHQFNGWQKPILTDSGGYQVYSLAEKRKIKEEGVTFQSHIDGSKHFFSPENVIDIQRSIGADIIMAFDECTPYPCDYQYAKNSMQLTHRWLKRCVNRWVETQPLYGFEQMLFPIVQGSVYQDLRKESAYEIASYNMEGNAIGGLSVGEPHDEMYAMTESVCQILPENKPRYLMGVGTPENLLQCISLGIDMFDCVMPTRNGRNGNLFTWQGIINIKNQKWSNDFSVIDEQSDCILMRNHTKSYLRHLFIAQEILGLQLASINNLSFYLSLMQKAREKITEGNFATWRNYIIPTIMQKL